MKYPYFVTTVVVYLFTYVLINGTLYDLLEFYFGRNNSVFNVIFILLAICVALGDCIVTILNIRWIFKCKHKH